MRAHTPPFTKPGAAYDSRRLYDETSAIAAAQDAKLDPISDVESKVRTAMQYLYHAQLLLKEVFPSRDQQRALHAESAPYGTTRWFAEQGIPAESTYLASFAPNADIPEKSSLAGGRIATPAEIDELRDVLTAEELKGFGIGDVDPRHVAETATTVATSQHPMAAEALRDHDERLNGPEDHL